MFDSWAKGLKIHDPRNTLVINRSMEELLKAKFAEGYLPAGAVGEITVVANVWCPPKMGFFTDGFGNVRILDFRTAEERAADERVRDGIAIPNV